MVLFLLAGLAAYLAWEPIATWLKTISGRRLPLLALLFVLGMLFYAQVTGSLQCRLLSFARVLAVAPETAQVVLGAAAGVMCRTFPHWTLAAGLNPLARAVAFAIVMAGLLIAALAGPHLWRIRAFETPYVKLELATPVAEKLIDLEAQRELDVYSALDGVVRTGRIIQFDCGLAALKVGGFATFKSQQAYKNFGYALSFREKVVKLLGQVAKAEREGYDVEGLKPQVGSVANHFFQLLIDVSSNDASKDAALKEKYKRAEAALAALSQGQFFATNGIEIGATSKKPSPNGQKNPGAPDGDEPQWCEEQEIPPEAYRKLIGETRFVYGAVGVMFGYAGNIEGVLRVYQLAQQNPNLKGDQNVNAGLGEALHVAERDAREVERYFERALEIANDDLNAVVAFGAQRAWRAPVARGGKSAKCISDDAKDQCAYAALLDRYKRARLNLKLRLAYLWAQERVRWPTALAYAKENYDAMQDGKLVLYPCLDSYETFLIQDTYAFVKLSFQAHNYQVHGAQPEPKEVREARWLLEGAVAKLRAADPTPSCLAAVPTKLWLRRLGSHLKLADALSR